jgi:uncharacterized DUF497 family protein
VPRYGWDRFEWDDENKKNGNVRHLRDHGIEPEEAEECFFHDYTFCWDERRFDDVYILYRVAVACVRRKCPTNFSLLSASTIGTLGKHSTN